MGTFLTTADAKDQTAVYPTCKTRLVRPASGRPEIVAVVSLMLIVGSTMGLRFFLLAAQEQAVQLKPYQRLDSALTASRHQVYRTLLSCVGDIEDQRVQEGQWPEAVLLEEEGIPPFASHLMPAPADRLQWVSYDGGTWVDYLGTDIGGTNQISYVLRLIDLHGSCHPHPHPGVDYDPERSVAIQVWIFDASGRY